MQRAQPADAAQRVGREAQVGDDAVRASLGRGARGDPHARTWAPEPGARHPFAEVVRTRRSDSGTMIDRHTHSPSQSCAHGAGGGRSSGPVTVAAVHQRHRPGEGVQGLRPVERAVTASEPGPAARDFRGLRVGVVDSLPEVGGCPVDCIYEGHGSPPSVSRRASRSGSRFSCGLVRFELVHTAVGRVRERGEQPDLGRDDGPVGRRGRLLGGGELGEQPVHHDRAHDP